VKPETEPSSKGEDTPHLQSNGSRTDERTDVAEEEHIAQEDRKFAEEQARRERWANLLRSDAGFEAGRMHSPKSGSVLESLQDGELVVRFFGMKDCDGNVKVAANLSRAVVRVGPFELEKGQKLVAPTETLTQEMREHKVHSGFWQIHQSIHRGCLLAHGRDLVEEIVHRAGRDVTKRVVVTGHSMGAALAAVTAYQLANRYPQFKMRLYVVQLGAPKYARKLFSDWLTQELRGRLINIVLEGDPTPKAPRSPPFFGWYTPGERVMITSGQLFGGKSDDITSNVHFQYWQVLRSLLAFG